MIDGVGIKVMQALLNDDVIGPLIQQEDVGVTGIFSTSWPSLKASGKIATCVECGFEYYITDVPICRKCGHNVNDNFKDETKYNKDNQLDNLPFSQRKVIENFFDDIDKICQFYGITISHEDKFGSFELTLYNKDNIDWLKSSNIMFKQIKEESK